MIRTGLDRLLADTTDLRNSRYALLSHAAAVTERLEPGHLALAAAFGPPALLLAPEHGYYGTEQDMVPSPDSRDPLTGSPIASLYGDSLASLRPSPGLFDGVDVLLVDLQDVGCRFYTFAATAVWAAEAALEAGCEVRVLDRPNPLGGERVEGNLPRPGLESFVGAFRVPVRHGLTLGEIVRLEARRRGWSGPWTVVPMEGWRRTMRWEQTGRPWIPPSPNMPTVETARVYSGCCLLEATRLSEGRGTTRPFRLVGAPGIAPLELARRLGERGFAGLGVLPAYFRPQFQKHAGELCGGVELVVTDADAFEPYRFGVELLSVLRRLAPAAAGWRREPYEFVAERPAIDLLTGDGACREALEGNGDLEGWIAGWRRDEDAFRAERQTALLYPEEAV